MRLYGLVVVLSVSTFSAVLFADPPGGAPPCNVVLESLYGVRLTHMAKSPGVDDRFRFEFEVLNWSGADVAGVIMSLNTGAVDPLDPNPPSIFGAEIDADGRPLGVGASPPAGNQPRTNDWIVLDSSSTRVCWTSVPGGTPIPHPQAAGFDGLLDPDFAGVPLAQCVSALQAMIPGSEGAICGNAGVITVEDAETIDDGDNVLDGFVIVIDDLEPDDVVSLNWHFIDAVGDAVGMVSLEGAVLGDNYGFGTLNLYRFGPAGTPGPLFDLNAGFDPIDCSDTSSDSALFWAEDEDPISGADGYPINPIPAGIPGQGECFAMEVGQLITARFRDAPDSLLQFDGLPQNSGFNTGSFTFIAPDGEVTYDVTTGFAAFGVLFAIAENPGNDGYPNDTYAFQMALRHDGDLLEIQSVGPAGPLLDDDPDFFEAAIGAIGFTLGVVYDFVLASPLTFEDATNVVQVDYETRPGALLGDTSGTSTLLEWTNNFVLETLPISNLVTVGDAASKDAGLRHGRLSLRPDVEGDFLRGDCSANGGIDIADAIFALCVLFDGGGADCLDACDSNDDGAHDIADPIYLLSYLFIEGPDPSAPFPLCGADPTADALECEGYAPCP